MRLPSVYIDGMPLNETDRAFFRGVSEAAFANPFGSTRYRLDAELTGLKADDPRVVPALVSKVSGHLDTIPSSLDADETRLVEDAILFEAFHRSADDFDALIQAQKNQEQPVAFDAHVEVGRALVERGFPEVRVGRALELFYQLRRAYTFLTRSLVGGSAPMLHLRERLWSQLFTGDVRRYERHLWNRMEDFSAILEGETGTGKTAAAAAVGRSGFIPFKDGRFTEGYGQLFLPLNLSELPGTLLESALFGHEKGAFTGAVARHEGAFDRTSPHGVIFLDEIGEVDVPTQIKLLRVLQERVFTPVGSTRPRRFEGRVLAATHRSLDTLREQGRFRDDFFYRLCSDTVVVPPLRDRLAADPAELDLLVDVLVTRMVGVASPSLAEETSAIIRSDMDGHSWPGNVRELEQCVRRVLLTGRCGGASRTHGELFAKAARGELDAKQLLDGYCAHLHKRHGTYEAVARITKLDRRTVKKNILAARGDDAT